MRKFLNLNEQEENIWTEEEMKELYETEKKNGLYAGVDFEEWLDIKKENDFEEVNKVKFYVTFKLEARYVAEVEADMGNIEEARNKAINSYQEADFGSATDIDGNEIFIENENGDIVWERE